MKGYRTITWNLLNAAAFGMTKVMEASAFGYSLDEGWKTAWLLVYFAINLWLRFVTTGPVGGPRYDT